jgi:hypothetical protein
MTNETVKIDPEAIEPHEYFAVLKENVKAVDADMLQKQLEVVGRHLIQARDVGQKSLVNQLALSLNSVPSGTAVSLAARVGTMAGWTNRRVPAVGNSSSVSPNSKPRSPS